MEKFRNLSNNIFFKIFLAFLGLTFVMFGVSGFILGNKNTWVAKVDGKTIQYDKFLQTLQNNKEVVLRSNNTPEATKYLQSLQFKQDVLQQMITKNLIQSLQKKFQIYPDKNLILQAIVSNPTFKGSDGKFDRNLYSNLLKSNHLSEPQHITDVSDGILGSLIIQSFVVPQSFNQNLAKDLYQYRFETRDADLITISTKNVGNVKSPNQFELNAFFEENNSKFALPEMRRVSFVSFGINDLKQKAVISDEEIDKEYQNNKEQYKVPESRNFYHILLSDEKEANQFVQSIGKESANSNPSDVFTKLALAKGKDKATILLKNISKKDLPKEISDDVFSLANNQYSKVLKSSMGFHIFYLTSINQATDIPLAKVKNSIKSKLLLAKEEHQAKDQFQAIEDEMLATNSLDKVAEKFNFDIDRTLPKFSSEGMDSRNIKVQSLDNFDNFIKNSFVLGANKVSKIFFSKANNKYYILSVDEISPSRKRSLDEVKVLVTDLWAKHQKQQKLHKLADDVTKKINANIDNLNLVVRENGLKITKQLKFPRFYMADNNGKKVQYADKLLNNIFATTINHATNPSEISDDELVIAIVRNVQSPKIDEQALKTSVSSSQNNFQNDILAAYNQYIQKQFPVEVNQKLIQTSDKAENE